MKIVYCIIGTFNSGGMERVLANKANYLVRSGHEISIVTTDQQGRKPYFSLDERIDQYDLGINYTDNNSKGLLYKLLDYPNKQGEHRRKLSALLHRMKADIVISMFDTEVSFLYKIKDGSKKILEIHFSRYKRLQYNRKGLWKFVDRYRSALDLRWAKRYDRFVVLTQEDKGYWGDLSNMMVIPNANSFTPQEQANLLNKRVLAVGRYDYQKGFDELIHVWKEVYEQHPDWSLHIFGHGPLKGELQVLISSLGLQEVVHLCNPVTQIELEYMSSSILAMTSRYEGLPMTLLEAQACGLPLVAYACKCGPKDIIRHGKNGYLLAEGDRQGMAKSLIHLIEKPSLRAQMGQASRDLSINYSEERIMKQWLSLFSELKKS